MSKKLIWFIASLTLLFTTDYLLAQPTIEYSNSYEVFPRLIKHLSLRKVSSEISSRSFLLQSDAILYSTLNCNGVCMGFTTAYDKESLPKGCPNGYTRYSLKDRDYYLICYNGFYIFNNEKEACQKLAEIIKERS
jgi:hypothetical protein